MCSNDFYHSKIAHKYKTTLFKLQSIYESNLKNNIFVCKSEKFILSFKNVLVSGKKVHFS